MTQNLSELWREAREYGRVTLYTSSDGTYNATISFNTIKHVELDANSGYYLKTPEEAIQKAIDKAREIVGDIVNNAEKFKVLGKK